MVASDPSDSNTWTSSGVIQNAGTPCESTNVILTGIQSGRPDREKETLRPAMSSSGETLKMIPDPRSTWVEFGRGGLGVAVGWGVGVGGGVGVAVGCGVGVGGTGVAVGSGVAVGCGVGVAVGSGVAVGMAVAVGGGTTVGVGVLVAATTGTVGATVAATGVSSTTVWAQAARANKKAAAAIATAVSLPVDDKG